MQQSCHFVKVCDCEFNKNHIEVNLFSLQLCVHEKGLTILSEKVTKFVSKCWKLITEDSSYLERGPLMWMMPLHLRVNQKSDYDDDPGRKLEVLKSRENS